MSVPTGEIGIAGIASYLPDAVNDNTALVARYGFDADFISDKLGIETRHYAAPNETTADLATRAAEAMLDEAGLRAADIDLLVVVTQTPDYLLPHTSALVHERLGAPTRTAAFDISLGCSGFIYALAAAVPMMAAHDMQTGLLVTAETYSKLISLEDRATAPLFGDGAAATLLTRDPVYYLGRTTFGTDGLRHRALIAAGSGTRDEPSAPLFMDGRAIFSFVMTEAPKDVAACLTANGVAADDVERWVFHQASAYMLQSLAKRLGIADERLVIEMADCGNTTSSTIPIALERRVLAASPQPRTVFLSGFGVGLSWASTVLTLAKEAGS